MMSVFDGGDGSTRGGKSERSRESGDLLPDDALERCGDGIVACMLAIICTMYMRICFGYVLMSSGDASKNKTGESSSYIPIRLLPAVGRGFQFQLQPAPPRSTDAPPQSPRPSPTRDTCPNSRASRQLHCPRRLFLNALCDLGSSGFGGRVNDETRLTIYTARDEKELVSASLVNRRAQLSLKKDGRMTYRFLGASTGVFLGMHQSCIVPSSVRLIHVWTAQHAYVEAVPVPRNTRRLGRHNRRIPGRPNSSTILFIS
jgi:hypothetical protein